METIRNQKMNVECMRGESSLTGNGTDGMIVSLHKTLTDTLDKDEDER